MKHVHVMDIRPDVITRTGVIQPYSVREIPPMAVARHSVAAFESTARPRGPAVRNQAIEPEEFASRAKRVATAVSAGARLPKGTDPKLIQAARYIREGKPFAIKSAGRAAQVAASPASPRRVIRALRRAGGRYMRDYRGNLVVVRSHRQGGSYWNIFGR